jgi:AraC-like DNA-binding protein
MNNQYSRAQKNEVRNQNSGAPLQNTPPSADENFLKNVRKIVNERMNDEKFSIETFSFEAGYSTTQFYRLIKRLTGEPPSAFLRTARLQRASMLLNQKTKNVSQVAYAVGFCSLSYFNKCFKKQYGVTPGQFSNRR